ncbi:hypothetical protein N4V73_002037 [Salmonella enterica subsp. enterica serovar Meleagridis]|uniref:Uncharacterized protein n=1 Tax=Salmonella enterica TaxID=28901 RepID=A0A8E9Z4Z7_SALER|nr:MULTISPECIES: hypothetical protein [Salmonella]EEB1920415.1 hypothetical protein [Salmonella enterica subsp. enterica]EGA4892173.1 hypothetical protein [Salmonella enterica subsp. enterica serovar Typhimurium]EGA4907684.1 hypothetical protein [Salmonella enterica subsp. enterica serovar Thompson]MBJ3204407.1 hypothetical protein [Salmonella enterica subsp. enterica serovar Give]QVB98476.1 hypothetical protein JYN08_00455 [Salmonella enterica subsp. enterica serovar Meleagridis str. 0047]HD
MAEILIKHLTIQAPASHCAQRSATSHSDEEANHASGDRSNAGNNGACRCADRGTLRTGNAACDGTKTTTNFSANVSFLRIRRTTMRTDHFYLLRQLKENSPEGDSQRVIGCCHGDNIYLNIF